MIRIALLGNCQVDVLGKLLLASALTNIDVRVVEIWRHKASEFEALQKSICDHEIIVTQELSTNYGVLSTENLRATGKVLLTIQNIFFQGYHPDCSYIGPMGGRIKSPVGDYHSQTVFDQWQAGRSVAEAQQALNAYPEAAVREVFQRSASELLKREAGCDVPISQEMLEPTRDYLKMYTFNHPSIELHRTYLRDILRALGIRSEIGSCPDPLLQHTQWPVYSAVRNVFGLPSLKDQMTFRASRSLGGRDLSALEMCEQSYKIYDSSKMRRA